MVKRKPGMSNKKTAAGVTAREPISVIYKEEDIGKELIKKIISWYAVGDAPLHKILRMANEQRNAQCRGDLYYLDVYSILFNQYRTKVIVQRTNRHQGEMLLTEFATFFKKFREGHKFNDCLRAIGTTYSLNFCKKIYQQLLKRWKQGKSRSDQESEESENARQELLDLSVIRHVQGKAAIVIFIRDIPEDLKDSIARNIPGISLDTVSDKVDESGRVDKESEGKDD